MVQYVNNEYIFGDQGKEFVQTGENICMTTVLKLYPCRIQHVVFSQAECCDRNHTLGMEKKPRKLNKELGATWIKFQFFFSGSNNFRA